MPEEASDIMCIQVETEIALANSKNMLNDSTNATILASQPAAPPCYLLQNIPVEVRNQIYKEVLVSDVLSSSRAYRHPRRARNQPPTLDYGLSPVVLRTCRKMYEGGSEILYGMNKFIIDCIEDLPYGPNNFDI
jgi:hypothetical protein